MPSDISGTEIIEENVSYGQKAFKFVRGPIFGNIILADEINRTPPKTQAALLEAMQEHRVTAAGKRTCSMSHSLSLPHKTRSSRKGLIRSPRRSSTVSCSIYGSSIRPSRKRLISSNLPQALTPGTSQGARRDEIIAFQELIRRVPVADTVVRYAVQLVARNTAEGRALAAIYKRLAHMGAGPRASQYLILGAKTRAILSGRYNPDVDDVRSMAVPVLRHRIIPNFNAEADGVTAVSIVEKLLANI